MVAAPGSLGLTVKKPRQCAVGIAHALSLGMATTHQILFVKDGENSDTPPTPRAPWANQVDLTETATYCLNWDNDMPVECRKYEVRAVDLPDWLPAKEWCIRHVEFKYLWAVANPEWPEAWQRGLINLESAQRLACVKLLQTKKFRSAFRESLRDQLVAWLESSDRKYPEPFTFKQWAALLDVYTVREARKIDERLYRDRNYTGMTKAVSRAA